MGKLDAYFISFYIVRHGYLMFSPYIISENSLQGVEIFWNKIKRAEGVTNNLKLLQKEMRGYDNILFDMTSQARSNYKMLGMELNFFHGYNHNKIPMRDTRIFIVVTLAVQYNSLRQPTMIPNCPFSDIGVVDFQPK